MKVDDLKNGDLVKTTRASIGVPLDTAGLILQTHKVENTVPFTEKLIYYDVQLFGRPQRIIRRIAGDLEPLSESR